MLAHLPVQGSAEGHRQLLQARQAEVPVLNLLSIRTYGGPEVFLDGRLMLLGHSVNMKHSIYPTRLHPGQQNPEPGRTWTGPCAAASSGRCRTDFCRPPQEHRSPSRRWL